MDDIDRAQVNIEALTKNPPRKPEGPAATGFCLNCDHPLPEGLRWCDGLCRDDWVKYGSYNNR